MGLQYFEAISPAVVASIVAVVTKAQITGEEVAGYFRYPFLSPSLPSSIYYIAIIIGFYGCAVGLAYAYMTKYLKVKVHDWFHAVRHDHNDTQAEKSSVVPEGVDEQAPLLSPNKGAAQKRPTPERERSGMWDMFAIANEPKRAAVAGALAGAMVGWIGIFLPHVLFWGEAQLQNLIDKGRTELPVFGESGNIAASSMIHHAICMVDEKEGFGIGCSVLIAVAKTIVIGLSLGTGIVGKFRCMHQGTRQLIFANRWALLGPVVRGVCGKSFPCRYRRFCPQSLRHDEISGGLPVHGDSWHNGRCSCWYELEDPGLFRVAHPTSRRWQCRFEPLSASF